MASGPITSWEIDGETEETVSDFILGGSKITADGDCSHEIKRHHWCTCVPNPPPISLPIPSLWVIPVHRWQINVGVWQNQYNIVK